MRRLPIFFLLDVSESMVGDNLRQLQQGLERLVKSLRTDPHALESVFLSVIAFAGKPRTLAPLVELAAFYPPRLPVGSGTSLGLALEHLMNEIDRQVVKTTPERKGDWRPIVYLMTDGKPTDPIDEAITRWQRDFAHRATLVAIGIGHHAALQTLQRLTEHVLLLQADTEEDFKRFVDWVTLSVVAQSRSVSAGATAVSLAKPDDSILKTINQIAQAATVDEDFVIISGRCQATQLPYLMKYERMVLPTWLMPDLQKLDVNMERHNLVGVFPLENDYFELSDERGLARTIHSDALIGAPGCPHCGNPIGFAMCGCGGILCIRGEGPAVCPHCKNTVNFSASEGEGFDVNRARG